MKKIVLCLLSFLLIICSTDFVFAGADREIQRSEVNLPRKKLKKAHKKISSKDGFEAKLKKMQFPDKLKLREIVIGNPNAPITLIIYSSFTCSHCREFHLNIFPKFKKEYVDTGKVKVYLRCFLDDVGALEAAVLMRCFGEDNVTAISKIYHEIYSQQKDWLKSQDPRTFLKNILIKMGYSQNDVERCIADRKISAGLMEYMQRALKDVHSVPAFVCGENKHEGTISYEQLVEMLPR